MMNARIGGRRATLILSSLALVAALAVGMILPAAAWAGGSSWGAFYGYAQDANSLALLPGIKVQAFIVNGSTYTPGPFTFTDNTGNYVMLVPQGLAYRVLFTDPHNAPHQTYADAVSGVGGYLESGTTIPVAGQFYFAFGSMPRASLIQVSVHRAGQWSTPLQGMTVRITDASVPAARYYTTDKNGSYARGGAPAGAYEILVSDPTHRFSELEMPSMLMHALSANDEWIASGTMTLTPSSADVGVSKPSGNGSVKKGKKLSVSGTLSKKMTSPKKMRLDAYQWSPSAMAWVLNKQADLKITKSGKKSAYSGTIKLPHKGSWRLVAVFTGNSSYAESGSKYKSVTAN